MHSDNDQYNNREVQETLKAFLDILHDLNVRHLFLGSLVLSAIHGKQHRRLGDFDVLLDISKHNEVKKKLLGLGYIEAKGMFSFARKYLSIETLVHPTLVSIGYFYGTWRDDGSFLMGGAKNHLSVDARALQPTEYTLYGQLFQGLPKAVIASGIHASKHNPKRIEEVQILQEQNIQPMKDDYIHVTIGNVRSDWLYCFSMKLLNMYGAIRVKLGKPFDPWRSKIQ